LVVEVAEAVGGPRGGLDGPVGGFGRGVGDVGLQEAQDLGPPGFDGLGEPLEFGGVRVGAPGVKAEQLVSNVVPVAAGLGQGQELAEFLSSTGFDGGFQLPLSRLLGEVVGSVLRLELDRGHEADLAVQAAEVEPVDVLGDCDLQVVDVLPGSAVADALGLEQA